MLTESLFYSEVWNVWLAARWTRSGQLTSLEPVPGLQSKPSETDHPAPKFQAELLNALQTVFDGEKPRINLPQPKSRFQNLVRNLLWAIKPGSPITYGEAASRIGNRSAARAVGQACARNELAILVPCHRVVGAITMGGYRWGLELKNALLAKEQRPVIPTSHSHHPAGSPIRASLFFED